MCIKYLKKCERLIRKILKNVMIRRISGHPKRIKSHKHLLPSLSLKTRNTNKNPNENFGLSLSLSLTAWPFLCGQNWVPAFRRDTVLKWGPVPRWRKALLASLSRGGGESKRHRAVCKKLDGMRDPHRWLGWDKIGTVDWEPREFVRCGFLWL
jgi:hypothetical protein